MITLKEVIQLDEKVNSAVHTIQSLREENRLLTEKITSYQQKIEKLETDVLAFQQHQEEIEAGIKNAVSALDLTLGHIEATLPPAAGSPAAPTVPSSASAHQPPAAPPARPAPEAPASPAPAASFPPPQPQPAADAPLPPLTRAADLPSFVEGLKEQIKAAPSAEAPVPSIQGLNTGAEIAFNFAADSDEADADGTPDLDIF